MKEKNKVIKGKNGLRNYQFESVEKDKSKRIYDSYLNGYVTQTWYGMFYKKKCLYCNKEFEARRVDTAFCCQGCQKADLRLRKKGTK